MKYYIDTCIWLNILLEERGYCKGSKEFLHNLIFLGHRLFYSGLVLRELKTRLKRSGFDVFRENINRLAQKVYVAEIDKKNAKALEERYHSGYIDMLHLSISKRMGMVLVTRDKRLLHICDEENVVVLEL